VVVSLLGRPGLSDAATAGLRRLAALRQRVAARQAEVERLDGQTAGIERDEERIRANMQAVPTGNALHTRLIRQLDTAEQRMDALRTAISQANAAAEEAQKDLVAAVSGFTL